MVGEPKDRELGDEAIDAGMREAFGKAGTGRSVLARLESKGGPIPRMVLVGTGSEAGPVVRTGSGEIRTDTGRYQVSGEIARGGVGVVLKGRDVDLGRDVAVKVLLEKHDSNEEVIQRFVEEAQIGGQLQHPGIVPVHELGITAEGRPFIAMKLVKGRTLTAMLLERPDPASDRPRYLGIFLKVCQTVAYAHSRRVVHRDLKPSNVMVGSFGEVQVLDWGLAKVLSRGGVEDERRASLARADASMIETVRSAHPDSDSMTGSVLGTPEYMAPEQAEGRVEDIDERTDVFALGAILCEIVTGQPPYRGEETHPLVEARECRQADALARLDDCSADPDLVALAKRCLLRRQTTRPRDAGEVARIVDSYLTGVEERARAAEVAAAEATVEARGERKARRLTLALSVAVLVAVLLGAGGWIWLENDRRRQAEDAAETVNAALVEAARLRGEAKRAPAEDPSEWENVRAEAERIMTLVDASSAPPEVRRRAEAFLAAVRGEADRAYEAAAAARKDRETADALFALSLLRGDDFDPRTLDAEYRRRLAAYGIDVDVEDPGPARERTESSAVAEELIAALDDLAAARRAAGDGEGSERVLALLRAADPEETRTRIRRLSGSGDAAGLAALRKDRADLSAETLLLLGDRLGRAGDVPGALEALEEARERTPTDARTVFLLGFWKGRADPPDHAGAASLFSLLGALCPGAAAAAYHHGQALHGQGDQPGALGRWLDALAADPKRFGFLRERILETALATAQKLRFAAVGGVLVGELERAAKLAPDRTDVQLELGLALARAGSWAAARDALAKAVWVNERDLLVPLVYAVSLCRTGERAKALEAMREIVLRRPEGWMRRFALPAAGRIVHRPPARLDAEGNPQKLDLPGIGRGLLAIGAPDAALAAYEAFLLDHPASSAAELGRGLSLFYLDRRKEAETAFRRAAELDPADAAPLYWLGSLRAAAGAPEEAYRIWDDAFERDPDHLRLRKTLTDGPIRNDTGAKPADVQYLAKYSAMIDAEPEVRVGVLREAVLRAPDNISLARDLAINLRLCGRDREAARASLLAIERADRKGKQRGWNYAQYATLLAESGDPEVRDPEEALAIAMRGIEAEDTPYGHVARGIALYRLGRYEAAVEALEGASTVKIDRGLYLTMARLRAGDRPGAERELDASLLTIANFWKGRPLPPRVVALQSEACGLLGRAVPEHR